MAAEHYADFGPFAEPYAVGEQHQTLFAVIDYKPEAFPSIEFGIGHGFTAASDDLVLKMIIGMEF